MRVSTTEPGLSIEPLSQTPFVPEIPHAVVRFERVPVPASAVLEGDGYERYLKPFRTVEDIHVHLAMLGYLIGVARRSGWPEDILERAISLTLAGSATAEIDPLAPATHVALAGLIGESRLLLQDCESQWASAPEPERERWLRDRPLLQVAQRARSARRDRAWARLAE